jgi:hypothetical protein
VKALYLFGNRPDNESTLNEISIPDDTSALLSLLEWKGYAVPELVYIHNINFGIQENISTAE